MGYISLYVTTHKFNGDDDTFTYHLIVTLGWVLTIARSDEGYRVNRRYYDRVAALVNGKWKTIYNLIIVMGGLSISKSKYVLSRRQMRD